jgi:cell division ATPase FtsA
MLNILKNITSLIKKKPFFTFVVVCLLILMCINSNCLQIIEGKRGRIKKRDLQNAIESNKNAIESNKNAIEKNKQKMITLLSKLYSIDNNDSIEKPTIGLQIGKK